MNGANRMEMIYLWSLALFTGSLCLPNSLFNIAIGCWALGSIGLMIQSKTFPISALKKNKLGLGMILLFASLAIGVAYSTAIKAGLFMLERSLLFLVAPILMIAVTLVSDREKALRFAHGGFVVGVVVAVIRSWVWAFMRYFDPVNIEMYPEASFRINYYFSYHGFASANNIHAVYLAVYLLLAIFILLETLRKQEVRGIIKRIAIGSLILLTVGIFQLKSANISFTFILLLLLYALTYANFDKGVSRLWSLGFAICSGLIMCILLYKGSALTLEPMPLGLIGIMLAAGWGISLLFPRLQTRNWLPNSTLFIALIMGILALTIILPQIGAFERWANANPSNISARYWNWRSATDLILQSPIFGLGTGEHSDALLERYAYYDFKSGIKYEYNEHSQYLRYWLEAGLLSLFAFVWVLYELYERATRSAYFPFIVLTLASVLFCVTESALARRHFISFFVFFSLLYSYAYQSGKRPKTTR